MGLWRSVYYSTPINRSCSINPRLRRILSASKVKAPPKYRITPLWHENAYLSGSRPNKRRICKEASRPTRNPDPACAPKPSDAPPAPIAQYVPLHPDTIKRLLARFRKYGLNVLDDRSHPRRAPVLTPKCAPPASTACVKPTARGVAPNSPNGCISSTACACLSRPCTSFCDGQALCGDARAMCLPSVLTHRSTPTPARTWRD